MNYNRRNNPHKPTKTAHFYVFCGLRKLNTLNLRLFHTPLNSRNHFSTVLIKTNWYTTSCKYSQCWHLTSVNIPSSVTKIREYTFSGCGSLTSVKIPSSVTSIGERVFESCSLSSVYVYAETPPSMSANAFEGCDSKNCTLYVPKGTYDAYWLSEWGIFENIVEFDATNIRNIVVEPEAQENARYAVNGQRLTAPVKGINLVKYNNGRVKKEIVK